MSASPQHISSQLGSAFGLHAISDDIFPRNFPPCISDENVGFTSALFAYPRKKSLKPAWLCIRFARHLQGECRLRLGKTFKQA
jgi:hypothetical protein